MCVYVFMPVSVVVFVSVRGRMRMRVRTKGIPLCATLAPLCTALETRLPSSFRVFSNCITVDTWVYMLHLLSSFWNNRDVHP